MTLLDGILLGGLIGFAAAAIFLLVAWFRQCVAQVEAERLASTWEERYIDLTAEFRQYVTKTNDQARQMREVLERKGLLRLAGGLEQDRGPKN